MVQKSKGGKKCRSVKAGKKVKLAMKHNRKKNYKKKVVKKVIKKVLKKIVKKPAPSILAALIISSEIET